ncbi:MAG: hypothetical protein MJE68_20620 [Proteobacteria bacterium]|nr:hypothetical protein [Pseudomonadota bacterium]
MVQLCREGERDRGRERRVREREVVYNTIEPFNCQKFTVLGKILFLFFFPLLLVLMAR